MGALADLAAQAVVDQQAASRTTGVLLAAGVERSDSADADGWLAGIVEQIIETLDGWDLQWIAENGDRDIDVAEWADGWVPVYYHQQVRMVTAAGWWDTIDENFVDWAEVASQHSPILPRVAAVILYERAMLAVVAAVRWAMSLADAAISGAE